jgi:hypothetical protein
MTPPARITFIVPTFNVARYLDECLDSIVRASEPGDQIILVEDGSTDDTRNICRQWKETHPDLIDLIEQENQGLSAARNNGLRLAHNEHILFMDSDDVVNHCVMPLIREIIHVEQPDILVMDFAWWHPGEHDTHHRSPPCSHQPRQKLTDKAAFMRQTYCDGLLSACTRIYRRQLLERLGPEVFPLGRAYEEIASTPRLTQRASSLYYLDEVLFHYRVRDGSITRTKTRKNCIDLSTALAASGKDLIDSKIDVSVVMACNMAAARFIAMALQDCSRVPNADFVLYREVFDGGLTSLTAPLQQVLTALTTSGWHSAPKTIKHLSLAWRHPRLYVMTRRVLKWWKQHRPCKI